MADSAELLDTFKSGLIHENFEIQIDSIHKLSRFAQILEDSHDELLQMIAASLGTMTDEAVVALAEQLPKLAELIQDDNDIILNILIDLAKSDEVLVRNQALEAVKEVISKMSMEKCDKIALHSIQELINEDYWGRKCSAVTLITIVYANVTEDTQNKLRLLLKNFAAEDLAIVRRSIASDLVKLIDVMTENDIKEDIIPCINLLTQDNDVLVKEAIVDVLLAIAKKLGFEIVLSYFVAFTIDEAWKVRQKVAEKINEIVPTAKTEDETMELVEMFKKLFLDGELSVRVNASKNMLNFLQEIKTNFKTYLNFTEEKFEEFFIETIMPLIKMVQTDTDEVRMAFSSECLRFCLILRNDCFSQHVLPLLVDTLENDEKFECKENILRNMNALPLSIDITKSLHSTPEFIKQLIEQSNMSWRARRNLLVAIDHITQHSTSEFFNENIKHFYIQLLYDPVFSVRRTAPVLIPALIKKFGFEWAKTNLLPRILSFAFLDKYLLRYSVLFSLEELIYPSLDNNIANKEGKYLGSLKKAIEENENNAQHKKTLTKIVILLTRLGKELKKTEYSEILDAAEDAFTNFNDSFRCYSEDTLDNLQINREEQIFDMNLNNNMPTYLEGVLCLILRDFFPVLQGLLKDKIYNVRVKASATLRTIQKFCKEVKKEVKEAWVAEIIDATLEDEFNAIKEEIDQEFELKIELNNGYLQNLVKEQDTQLMKRQMGRKISDFSLPGIEVTNAFPWHTSELMYTNVPQKSKTEQQKNEEAAFADEEKNEENSNKESNEEALEKKENEQNIEPEQKITDHQTAEVKNDEVPEKSDSQKEESKETLVKELQTDSSDNEEVTENENVESQKKEKSETINEVTISTEKETKENTN